jgi:hypothetical protein
MKKALINPNEQATHISEWKLIEDNKYIPIFSTIENSQIVCDVADAEFPVAEPLFWADCSDNTVLYEAYLDTTDGVVKKIQNVPEPVVE